MISGRTGGALYTLPGYSAQYCFSASLAMLNDIDGDGAKDLLVGSAYGGASMVAYRILSGRTGGTVVDTFYNDVLGSGGAGNIGDVNADGFDDFGVNGFGFHSPPLYGVYLSNWPAPARYCTAKPNSVGCTPVLRSSSSASLSVGDELVFHADALKCGTSAGLVWSTSAASAPFGGGILCVGSNYQVLGAHSVDLPLSIYCPSGNCAYGFRMSRSYMLSHGLGAGSTFYAQVISRDPGFAYPDNIGLTDALAITVSP